GVTYRCTRQRSRSRVEQPSAAGRATAFQGAGRMSRLSRRSRLASVCQSSAISEPIGNGGGVTPRALGRVPSYVVTPKAIRAAIVQIGRNLDPLLCQSQLSDDLVYPLLVRENAPVRIEVESIGNGVVDHAPTR